MKKVNYKKICTQPPMWVNFMAMVVAPFLLGALVLALLAVVSLPFVLAQAILS